MLLSPHPSPFHPSFFLPIIFFPFLIFLLHFAQYHFNIQFYEWNIDFKCEKGKKGSGSGGFVEKVGRKDEMFWVNFIEYHKVRDDNAKGG
jgi:hypothetical protein